MQIEHVDATTCLACGAEAQGTRCWKCFGPITPQGSDGYLVGFRLLKYSNYTYEVVEIRKRHWWSRRRAVVRATFTDVTDAKKAIEALAEEEGKKSPRLMWSWKFSASGAMTGGRDFY